MVDFSAHMKKPAGQAKKPPALPVGDYSGVVKSFELGDSNKNKTPYVRFHLGLQAFPASAPASWKDDGREVSQSDIDLSKRQLRRDFFLTDDALWRLDDFLRSVGVKIASDGSTSYEEALPQAVGSQVMIEVQQYINENTSDIGNQVGKVVGVQ